LGKRAGKIIATLVGAYLGFMNPSFFGVGTKVWAGALYGASLGSTIWSVMHPPSAPRDYSKFDQIMNTVSSESFIPIIYGTRKWGGIQTWHKTSSDGKHMHKDIVICEGEIDSIYGVCANDLIMANDADDILEKWLIFALGGNIYEYNQEQAHVFGIMNIDYSDATVEVSDEKLYLHANGETTHIHLRNASDINNTIDDVIVYDYNGRIDALIGHLGTLGNGWVIVDPVPTLNDCDEIDSFDAKS
jgi:hypothetical protein